MKELILISQTTSLVSAQFGGWGSNFFSNSVSNNRAPQKYHNCRPNEEHTDYLNDPSCDNQNNNFMQVPFRPGCACKKGYVRYKAECMPIEFCPCSDKPKSNQGFIGGMMGMMGMGSFYRKPETNKCEDKPCYSASRFWYDSGLSGGKPVCDPVGYFKTLDCSDNSASCVKYDKITGRQIPDQQTIQKITQPLYENNKPPAFLPPAQYKPAARVRNSCIKLKQEMKMQGIRMSLLPSCARNGDFHFQQQDRGGAYCAYPETGEEVLGTRNNGGKINCKNTVELCTAGRVYEACSVQKCTTCQHFSIIGQDCRQVKGCSGKCVCLDGRVYDEKAKACVEPENCYRTVSDFGQETYVKPVLHYKAKIECNDIGCFCADLQTGTPMSGMKLSVDSLKDCKNMPEKGTCAHEIFITNENAIPMRGEVAQLPYCEEDGSYAWRQAGPAGFYCVLDTTSGREMVNTNHVNSDLVCSEIGLTTKGDYDFYVQNIDKFLEKPTCDLSGCVCKKVEIIPVGDYIGVRDRLDFCMELTTLRPETACEMAAIAENSVDYLGALYKPVCEKETGNYRSIQKTAKMPYGYFCVDTSTGEKISGVKSNIEKLQNCDFESYTRGPCHREIIMSDDVAGFSKQPLCRKDGFYEPKQCKVYGVTTMCECVDHKTGRVLNYAVEKDFMMDSCLNDPENSDLRELTVCQKQAEKEAERLTECDSDGNFLQIQYNGEGYFCVEKFTGKSVSGIKREKNSLNNCVFEPKGKCDLETFKCNTALMGAFCPQCNEDGSFQAKQCHGSTGYCWCVEDTVTGGEREDTRAGPGKFDSDCENILNPKAPQTKCQLENAMWSKQTGFMTFVPDCVDNGDYRAIQCMNAACWCVKSYEKGGQDGTTIASKSNLSLLDCELKLNPEMTKCQQKVIQKEDMIVQGFMDVVVPECVESGNFNPVQYNPEMQPTYYCVDITTGEIDQTKVYSENTNSCDTKITPTKGSEEVTKSPLRPPTPCEQESAAVNSMINNGAMDLVMPMCDENGSFQQSQYNNPMIGGKYCVDIFSGKKVDDLVYDVATNTCISNVDCPGDLVWNDCYTKCPKDCSIKDIMFKCVAACDATCACPQGTILLEKGSSECVETKNCPVILQPETLKPETPKLPEINLCPPTQVHNDCNTSCPKNCDNKDDFMICTMECRIGCGCAKGFVFKHANSDECVAEESCPSGCPANQVKSGCHDCPEKNCDTRYDDFIQNCEICAMGFFCGCPKGMIRLNDSSEECVDVESCPSGCPANQVKSEGCHDCPEKNCDTRYDDSMQTCEICAMGFLCGCPKGMIRLNNSSEECVDVDQCLPLEPIMLVGNGLPMTDNEFLDYSIPMEPQPEDEPIFIDDSGSDYDQSSDVVQTLNDLIDSISLISGDESTAVLV